MNSRYIRQTLLKEIGNAGQNNCVRATVAIIGCGGLGSIVGPYLAGAGIGKLILVDGDTPQLNNLHRQVFFRETDTHITKSEALANHIHQLNSEVEVVVHPVMIDKENIVAIVGEADIVVECTDDMLTKYLVNDCCSLMSKPLVYGAIHKMEGYVSFFENKKAESIHLRDIFPEPSLDVPSCSEVGVLPTIAGVIGLFQANEVLKYVIGFGESLNGKLLSYNATNNQQFIMRLKKTFSSNMSEVFDQENYQMDRCTSQFEIDLDVLRSNLDKYHVVSILEDHEHVTIFDQVMCMPLSRFSISDYIALNDPIVFYCRSGNRSLRLVKEILGQEESREVYSLSGGVLAVK